MSESTRILADFTGTFTVEGTWDQKPVDGRVLLNADQLVLVGPDTKETFGLSQVIDIGMGRVPPKFSQYFNDSVLVAFESADDPGPPRTATIEADGDAIDQFGTLLFKTQLHELRVFLNHPARVGGRVVNDEFVPATLYLSEEAVTFGDISTPFRVPLDSVVNFEQLDRTVDEEMKRVLSIRQIQAGTALTSEIAVRTMRLTNLLGRYLRTVYSRRLSDIREIDLSAVEKRLLVTLHSGGRAAKLAETLDIDPGQVSMLLNGLEEDELLRTNQDDICLTAKGRIALQEHLEDINE